MLSVSVKQCMRYIQLINTYLMHITSTEQTDSQMKTTHNNYRKVCRHKVRNGRHLSTNVSRYSKVPTYK